MVLWSRNYRMRGFNRFPRGSLNFICIFFENSINMASLILIKAFIPLNHKYFLQICLLSSRISLNFFLNIDATPSLKTIDNTPHSVIFHLIFVSDLKECHSMNNTIIYHINTPAIIDKLIVIVPPSFHRLVHLCRVCLRCTLFSDFGLIKLTHRRYTFDQICHFQWVVCSKSFKLMIIFFYNLM